MKTFLHLRELTGRKPEAKEVYNKKIGRVTIKINKERNGFVAYVDGDRLDVYRSQSEAEKASKEFLKQYRRMK